MKVVALISGGKDSTHNILHCLQRNHEIVALANLFPPKGIDELNSYMYQSVGAELIDLYAQCMEIPLFRKEIKGSCKSLNANYETCEGDEVEDLFELLQNVKKRFPDIQGVSSGAIKSSYQKVRVEQV